MTKVNISATDFASNHHHIINDAEVSKLINNLYIPSSESLKDIVSSAVKFKPVETRINNIFAIDGEYTQASLKDGYPSAALHFFQFGAVHFTLDALRKIEASRHPDPDDMSKLKNIDRVKFPLPTLNTCRNDCETLLDSVRLTLHEFLAKEKLGEKMSLLDTLAWFLFRQYKGANRQDHEAFYEISSSPVAEGKIILNESEMQSGFTFECPISGKKLYLIDAFRLHEQVNEQSGASGVCGYIAGVVEHLILLHLIRNLIDINEGLSSSLLIMDRPTGFFGNTSRLIVPMFDLMSWLFDNKEIYLAGLEKSGAFVEHARQIQNFMPNSSYIVLGNDHIYKFITPPSSNTSIPYASTSYYGHKVIFKTKAGQMYVISLPVKKLKLEPKTEDIPNLIQILTHVEQLKCDMYENALLPVALANKLVSLAAIPSSKILKNFAKSSISA